MIFKLNAFTLFTCKNKYIQTDEWTNSLTEVQTRCTQTDSIYGTKGKTNVQIVFYFSM